MSADFKNDGTDNGDANEPASEDDSTSTPSRGRINITRRDVLAGVGGAVAATALVSTQRSVTPTSQHTNSASAGNRPWIDVRDHGAVGDGLTDDTAAIQKAINACLDSNDDPSATTRQALAALYVPPGTYRITAPLNIESINFFHMEGDGDSTRIKPEGEMETALNINSYAFSTFRDFSIEGDLTESLKSAMRVEWVGVERTTSGCTFYNIGIRNCRFVTGIAIGVDSGTGQVDNCTFYSCSIAGAWSKGENIWYQSGITLGSGQAGNILNHNFYSLHLGNLRQGVTVNVVPSVAFFGGSTTGHEAAFSFTSSGFISIQGFRAETYERFLVTGGAAGFQTSGTVRDCSFAIDKLDSDDQFIRWDYGGSLLLSGLSFGGGAGRFPKVGAAPSVPLRIVLQGIASTTDHRDFVKGNEATKVIQLGHVQINSDGVVVKGTGLSVTEPIELSSAPTSARPPAESLARGSMMYDSTVGRPIFSDGKTWRDATGRVV